MIPAIAHAALLFALSAQPDLTFADDRATDLVIRKLGHAGAYAVLAVLVFWGVGARGHRQRAFVTLGCVAAYAVSDEVHQAFVPGRGPSPIDVGIDTLGGAAGLVVARRVLRSPAAPSADARDRDPAPAGQPPGPDAR